MNPDDAKNNYLRYSDVIHNAFEFYKNKIKGEIKNERQNNNNFVLIHFFDRIDKSLNKTKEYYLSNIRNLLESTEDPNRHKNIGVFRSILYVYDKDLDRCMDLLKHNYNLFPVGNTSIQEKSYLVKDIINKVTLKK